MKLPTKNFWNRAVTGVALLSMLMQPIAASAAQLNFAQSPLFVSTPIPPMVMLDISKDQQLYKKAYNDYSDLDGDGALETTYKHGIDYYGYFDSYKCYTYSAANKRYEPAVYNTKNSAQAADSAANLAAKYCSATGVQSTQWSGNFLNWASMTRIDAVRKLLYGGLRSPTRTDGDGNPLSDGDTATGTVLERSTLPNDAHSFAKYYRGADLGQLTPFGLNAVTTTSSTTRTIGTGDKTFTLASTANIADGDVVLVADTAAPTVNYMSGVVKNRSATQITLDNVVDGNLGGNGVSKSSWVVTNLSTIGLTICNTTLGGASPQNRSQTNTNLPRLRVARGNYSLWAANERWQCLWNEEEDRGSSNVYNQSSVPAGVKTPLRANVALDNKSDTGGKGDYFVRVQACVTGLFGTEKCKEYNQNNYSKPIGLLQVYGESGQIQFGLMTGSYNKNISGGVLRKNVGPLNDEVNADGTFVALAATGVPAVATLSASGYALPGGGSIITTLNKLRIWGYRYDDGTYIGGGTADNCNFQQTSITEGNCVSWGNPMSEIYYESLRYFSGKTTPTAAFVSDDTNKIAGLATANWPSTATTIISNANYCAPINILVFNASVTTNETDNQMTASPFNSTALNSYNVVTATTAIGTNEGITGTAKYFVGRTSRAGTDATTDNEYCDAKTQTGLGNMYGICPEGPTLGGSYLMGGLAHTAHTNRIRDDLTSTPVIGLDAKSLKVNTYGISLATNVPQIPIKLPGDTTARVIIQPAYRLNNAAPQGGGALVDMQIVSQTTDATGSKGKIYLNWEDSEQGGDYDQDMWGTLTYCLNATTTTSMCPAQLANTITVTTDAIAESTNQPQGFGYIISGTSKDGPHFHSGIEGFVFVDPDNVPVTGGSGVGASGGCSNCVLGDGPTTATYTISNVSGGSPLKDPLWYAAKYGGFKPASSGATVNAIPTTTAEWDLLRADGSAGADGDPDNYFLVSNPIGLEGSLNRLFVSIIATASASAAAANSSRLITNTKIYQAVFNTQDWSSKLLSFGVNAAGVPATTADWDAGQLTLNSSTINPGGRVILTYNKGVAGAAPSGIPFRWPTAPATPGTNELSAAQIAALKTNPANGTVQSDAIGQNRLNYIRGDGTNEGTSANDFRARPLTKLGDIVNSNINYVGPPSSGYADPTYGAFANTYSSRRAMLYVGANDGMLHGFDAATGVEALAYVPSAVYRRLSKLTAQNYSHTYYVDGSPAVEDAQTGAGVTLAWKSVLVGGYNSGGQGLYALNVSNPTTANFAESNAANLVMWEFTDADDPDMGYTYGDPLIRKMANGKWAAIVSGGYNNSDTAGAGEVACTSGTGTSLDPYLPAGCTVSRSGNAYLFIIYLDGPTGTNGAWVQGTDYFKINTGVGSTGTPNGLAGPFAADVNGDNAVDFIYAGDLRGNLWKFDVRSTTTSNWVASTSFVRLFTAVDGSGNAQPITSRPQWALHPTGQGFIVSFGTGKYMEQTDVNSPFLTQTVYGIWDRNNTTTVNLQTAVSGRSQLMEQILLTSSTSPRYRVLSKFLPNYGSTNLTYTAAQVASTDPNRPANSTTVTPQSGWFFDLSNVNTYALGERNVFAPDLRNGIAFYSSLWPSASACLGAAEGDNLVFSIGTGARTDFSVFDRDGNAIANSSDFVNVNGVNVAISSLGITGGAAQTPTFIRLPGTTTGGGAGASGYGLPNTGGSQNTGIQSTTGGKLAQAIYSFGPDFGRISWREITND